ncbi:MAG TPA: hypothetical protein DGT21_06255 [Armatimonadetes bacterium]|jgi:hypothetical protein|nr:hypothetical protein [Armatimonadota bacterium]
MRRLLLSAMVAMLSSAFLASAVAQFPAPTAVTLVDDPEDKAGTASVVEWQAPHDGPASGYQLVGYRVEVEQLEGKWAGERRIGESEAELLREAAMLLDPKATSAPVDKLSPWRRYRARVSALYMTPADAALVSEDQPLDPADPAVHVASADAATPGAPVGQWFDREKTNVLAWVLVYSLIVLVTIAIAQRHEIYIRPIAGLQAVNDAIGRATEMGRPILYVTGLTGLSDIATIASMLVLGHLARRTAAYETPIIVPCYDPLVMAVDREIVRDAMVEAGKPQNYNPDNIFYVTDSQFGYVAAVDGIMVREKPAANFFMGYFYAESLILAETGASTGAIQIAGTDSDTQLPFFITACDYTLMGEELYAAGAYLSRNPLLIAQLRGQDIGKVLITLMLLIGAAAATCAALLPEFSIFSSVVEWFASGG